MRFLFVTLLAWLSSTAVAFVPPTQRVPTALATAMTPLFPTQAWEGKEFRVTELQDMFAEAMQNFQNLMESHSTSSFDFDTDMKIAASVATTVRGNGVVSNEEMYRYIQQGIDQLVTTLAQVLAQLDGFSIEQKIAAALATVVISYPVSYQYYQYELAEEERLAAEKKAKLAEKKKAEALKAKAEKAKAAKGKEPKQSVSKIAKDTDVVADVAAEKRPAKGPKGASKEQLTMKDEVLAPVQEVATAQATESSSPPPLPVTSLERTVTVQVPASPRVVESTMPVMGKQSEDGGMDAYARAYAAMLSQVQAVQVAEPAPASPLAQPVATFTTDPPAVETSTPVRSGGGTASYLETLSRSA
ncbi:hypothetical protein FisN_6Hh437 [Fistulifera solaris]|uniref:Uncharacterized protein n=1 Tax=Fistulifera solaris TaxID=1519565 RepID=A0A1Z5K5Q6_FISSO|nr:hypothetical protein FisN_6Hh437 [Fistulifera solaris]|eukprot:GAX21546.1 hypothetical protein FisN_6Hh437 [Fistulifera solaris]